MTPWYSVRDISVTLAWAKPMRPLPVRRFKDVRCPTVP
jgi:hypothetical protein